MCSGNYSTENYSKLELFYPEAQVKRKSKNQKMQIEADQRFTQNEVNKLNRKYNVDVFQLLINGGKTFTAKPKIK